VIWIPGNSGGLSNGMPINTWHSKEEMN